METKFNNLADLCIEVDYQSQYSYEKRVDLFNKYSISTTHKFINPILLLTEFLLSQGDLERNFKYYGMSHSGNVKSAFNDDFKKGKSKYVEFAKIGELMKRYKVFHLEYNGVKRIQVCKITFFEHIEKGVFFQLNNFTFKPKRNVCFYNLAEEFCLDFGYNINFK